MALSNGRTDGKVPARVNMEDALKRVLANKGAGGVDGMTENPSQAPRFSHGVRRQV